MFFFGFFSPYLLIIYSTLRATISTTITTRPNATTTTTGPRVGEVMTNGARDEPQVCFVLFFVLFFLLIYYLQGNCHHHDASKCIRSWRWPLKWVPTTTIRTGCQMHTHLVPQVCFFSRMYDFSCSYWIDVGIQQNYRQLPLLLRIPNPPGMNSKIWLSQRLKNPPFMSAHGRPWS